MQDRQRYMEALRNADAAGDTEAARKLAQAIRRMDASAGGEKAGVTRSIADSIVELGAGILGAPADIAQSLGYDPVLPTSQEMLGSLAETTVPGFEGTVHSGVGTPAGMEERTRGGEIAKVGADVATVAAPLAAAPLMFTKGAMRAAPQATSTVGRIAQDIVQTTAKNPGTIQAAETAAGIGSGVGAAVGEAIAPGSEGAQTAGALAGSLAPVTAIPVIINRGGKTIKSIASIFSKSGQEARAGDIVRKMVEVNGGDVENTIRLLQMADDVGETAALKSGDEGLIRLENYIRQKIPDADRAMAEQNKQAMEEMAGLVRRLSATGDPQAFRMAAAMREQMYRDMVDRTIQAAQARAAKAGSNVSTPETAESTGEAAAQITEEAMRMLRQTENALWKEVPDDVPLDTTNLAETWLAMRNDITPELLTERISSNFQRAVSRAAGVRGAAPSPQVVSGATQQERKLSVMRGRTSAQAAPRKEQMTSGDLKTLRGDLLSQARNLRSGANPNFDAARRFDELADAVMRDMEGLPGYDSARSFTRQFNERFRQSFAGKTQRTGASGDVISPEQTMTAAFGGGGPTATRRFGEMEGAVSMASPELSAAMQIEQEKFLRTVAEKFLREDGTIKPGIEGFLKKNERLMSRFPQLRQDLSDAQSATARLQDAKNSGTARIRQLERSSLQEVVGAEDPAAAISRIVSGKNPESDFKVLANSAKRSGPDAVAGLRTAALESAAAKSNSFASLKENSTTMLQRLSDNGLIGDGELSRLKNTINRAAALEANAARTGGRAGEIGDAEVTSEWLDTMIRIAGAKAGATVAGKTSGATLVAAGQGSKFLRQVLERNPFNQVMKILEEAAKDPRLMADLMKKHRSPKLRDEAWQRLRAAIISAGLVPEGAEDGQNPSP